MKTLYYLKRVATLVLTVTIVGCGVATHEHYQSAVKSGFEVIPQVNEMESMFGEADHFITHYGLDEGPLVWNSEVYFWGKYHLTMQVHVELNEKMDSILRVVDEPKFYMVEIVRGPGVDGSPEFASDQPRFGLADWQKLVKAKGDFAVIGIAASRDRPVKGFEEWAKSWRASREQIRPENR